MSKLEKDKFRYTGLDVEATTEAIKICMQEYAYSLEDLDDIIKTVIRDEYIS